MNASAPRVGWSFWLQWVAACFAGLAVGAGLLLALSKGLAFTPHKAVMGAAVGATVGTLQWLVLSRQGIRSAWWVVATVIAWGLGAPAELIGGLPFSIAVLAVLAGVLQGIAIRGAIPGSVWWFPANLVAWSAFLATVRLTDDLSNPGLGIGVGFALVSAVTGMAMVWMLRREPAPLVAPLARTLTVGLFVSLAACSSQRGVESAPNSPSDSATVRLMDRSVQVDVRRVAMTDPAIGRLRLQRGRVFVAADATPRAVEVAIISSALAARLGDRADVIGQTVEVSGRPVVVVGVVEMAPPDRAAIRLWLLVRR